MRIEDFNEKTGVILSGAMLNIGKAEIIFIKKVHYLRCYKSKDNHCLKVLLDKKAPVCWNDNEY